MGSVKRRGAAKRALRGYGPLKTPATPTRRGRDPGRCAGNAARGRPGEHLDRWNDFGRAAGLRSGNRSGTIPVGTVRRRAAGSPSRDRRPCAVAPARSGGPSNSLTAGRDDGHPHFRPWPSGYTDSATKRVCCSRPRPGILTHEGASTETRAVGAPHPCRDAGGLTGAVDGALDSGSWFGEPVCRRAVGPEPVRARS